MPSGAEWILVVNLAIWALALYGLVCLFRAWKVRREHGRLLGSVERQDTSRDAAR